MSLPLWGELEKAQDDTTTIAQYIAEQIQAHEADPEAHLGEGESLEMHKKETVIDHPQGSVLGDKFTNQEFVLQPNFEDFNIYDTQFDDLDSSLGGFRIRTSATNGNQAYVQANGQYSPQYFNVTKNITFQVVASCSSSGDYTAYLLAGGDTDISEPPGIGFKIVNDAVYAIETVWESGGFEEYTTLIADIDGSEKHIYRAQVDTFDNVLYFFIDGEQVASWTPHTNEDVGLKLFTALIETNGNQFSYLNAGGFYLSIQP